MEHVLEEQQIGVGTMIGLELRITVPVVVHDDGRDWKKTAFQTAIKLKDTMSEVTCGPPTIAFHFLNPDHQ